MADHPPVVSTGAKAFGAIHDNRGVVLGDASGSAQVIGAQIINNNCHYDRPETPPSPSCALPFRRDPDFVDRGTLLDQIHEKCSAPASRIALMGLGGVGKSQLAIEHCYRTAERLPETWVFWVHASNAARLKQGFQDIADLVKLAGRNSPQANVFKLVRDWLRDEKHGRWLLVLDNADDAAVLSLPSSDGQQHLSQYLPPSRHGAVLVTSRTNQAASQLVEESDIVPIEPMDSVGAQALLQKKLGAGVDKVDIAELASALEYMPLALVQAAAYVQKRAPRCSVQQYLEAFRKSDKKRIGLLDYEAGNLRRDSEARNSIITTWQISFDHIRSMRPSAANLLSLMSFFDRQGIPEALLHSYEEPQTRHAGLGSDEENGEESVSEASDNGLENDVLTLREYSFISITTVKEAFEMHALVQLATRRWLKGQDQHERWKQQYIANLCAKFPPGRYENWAICQALFPHATSALAQKPKSEESLEKWALLLYHAAWYAWQKGSAAEAEEMATMSMEVRAQLFGTQSNRTLKSMTMVGLVRSFIGRWDAAEELFVQVMETSKKKLGVDHLNTLASMANLASIYRNQGRWDAAEELDVQVMETRKKKLGADHPDTLISMGNLASTYWNQGRLDAAEELFVHVVETRKNKLGADHPSTLNSMGNLASTYWNQGRWDTAEGLDVQVMEISKKKLGADHPNTLNSMANLASTYWNQGRLDAAEELFVQVVETRKNKLGADHPDTLHSMNNLAFTWKKQGHDAKAIKLMANVVQLGRHALGTSDPYYISYLHTLAEWKAEQVDFGPLRLDG